MERFSLDTNIFDRIAEDDETVTLVARLVEEGKIELVLTHIQRDELADVAQCGSSRTISASIRWASCWLPKNSITSRSRN